MHASKWTPRCFSFYGRGKQLNRETHAAANEKIDSKARTGLLQLREFRSTAIDDTAVGAAIRPPEKHLAV
jgi:hypothetical protein